MLIGLNAYSVVYAYLVVRKTFSIGLMNYYNGMKQNLEELNP